VNGSGGDIGNAKFNHLYVQAVTKGITAYFMVRIFSHRQPGFKQAHVFLFFLFITTHLISFGQSPDVAWVKKSSWIGGAGGSKAIALGDNAVYMTADFATASVSFGTVTVNGFGSSGNQGYCLIKYDTLGNAIWGRYSTGYYNYCYGKSVSTDQLGNVYVTGHFRGDSVMFGSCVVKTPFSTGMYDNLFVVKYNSAGTALWARYARGNNVSGSCYGTSIAVDSSGYCYLTGKFSSKKLIIGNDSIMNSNSSFPYNSDIFIWKFDPAGNTVWKKGFGGTREDGGVSISLKDQHLYLTGDFESSTIAFQTYSVSNASSSGAYVNSFLVKADTSGNVKWAKAVKTNGFTYSRCISPANNGRVYLSGTHNNSQLIFGSDTVFNNGISFYLACYDSSGTALWARAPEWKTYTSTSNLYHHTVDQSGNVTLTGRYNSSSIQFGALNIDITYGGYDDIFLVKYDGSGNPLWAKSIGGTNNDFGVAIASSASSIYFTGMYWSPSIGFGSYSVTASGGGWGPDDIYLAKLSGICSGATIVSQTGNLWKREGETATFSVTATGSPIVYYQWYKNGWPVIPAATNSVYTTPPLSSGDNMSTYYCKVSNCNYSNSVKTITDTVEVCSKANVVWQSYSQGVQYGDSVQLFVNVAGSAPFSFQWYLNNVPISGATSSQYYTPPLNQSDSGDVYYCEIINCKGFDTTKSYPITISTFVGIETFFLDHYIKVYPNPSSGRFHLNSTIPLRTVRVINVLGETIQQFEQMPGDFNFFIDRSGIYFLEAETDKGIYKRKIICTD
jgi:hypothetical protein